MTKPVVYDCRKNNREPGSVSFPEAVSIVDAATGHKITNVFYAKTSPPTIGRFVTGPDGEPMVNASSRRKVGRVTPDGKSRAKIEYDRLERWEVRRWVARSVRTGAVVAKSEGCE